MNIIDLQNNIRQYAGPGHWNDPDMLEIGNGMSYDEDKAHFSMWCMLAAPLIAGNDLRKMSPQTISILTNKEAIAIDQDSLGVEGFRYYAFDGLEIWVKPLKDDGLAVCFLNRSSHQQNIYWDWKAHNIVDTLSNLNIDFNKTNYSLHDVWAKKNIGTTDKVFKQAIGSHQAIMIKLSNTIK
jgi:alpha-galactosidase